MIDLVSAVCFRGVSFVTFLRHVMGHVCCFFFSHTSKVLDLGQVRVSMPNSSKQALRGCLCSVFEIIDQLVTFCSERKTRDSGRVFSARNEHKKQDRRCTTRLMIGIGINRTSTFL